MVATARLGIVKSGEVWCVLLLAGGHVALVIRRESHTEVGRGLTRLGSDGLISVCLPRAYQAFLLVGEEGVTR
jgi:hypothetical protein